jgi:hypothetical protein
VRLVIRRASRARGANHANDTNLADAELADAE